MTYRMIEYAVHDSVAEVRLSRPAKHNAFNLVMRDELFEVFTACSLDTSLRAVLISGRGRSFCAGADLTEFETYPTPFEARRIRFERDVWSLLIRMHVPLIALAQGAVVGSGLELFALCDVRIAAPDASFIMPEANLGLLSTACGTQVVPRLTGPQAALPLLLGAERWTGTTAYERGLAHRLVDPDQLEAEGVRLAGDLAALDPDVVRHVVRSIRSAREVGAHGAGLVEARRATLIAETKGLS